MALRATREAGLVALSEFVPRAGRIYAVERNVDRGPDNRANVSGLSPWVRHRLVTEQEIVQSVLQQHSLDAASKFVQEVFWRTYWKGWLELRPSVWERYTASLEPVFTNLTSAELSNFHAAVTGTTGIDGFDDWARELTETGYLHNHARMWFASIWIFTLQLPWQLGADFFLRNLLDGDSASNTLSWRWVAGLHTVGKTYLATASNIESFTGGRFRPRGLATAAFAIDDAPAPPPIAPPQQVPIPSGRVALLLHGDDLHAESIADVLEARGTQVVAVAAPRAVAPRSTLLPASGSRVIGTGAEHDAVSASSLVAAFTSGALTDGLGRAGNHFAVEAIELENLGTSAVIAWLQSNDVTALVTPYAPVGAVRYQLDRLFVDLAAEGITCSRVLRQWDSQAWPHAARGFFPFREQIPRLLRG